MPEHLLAAVDQADVGPVVFDPDRLDAIAMIRLLLRETLLDQRDRFVLRVRAQHVIARGRQAGRFMRRVVPGEIGRREHDEQQRRGDRRAGGEAARDDEHEDRDRNADDAGDDRLQRGSKTDRGVRQPHRGAENEGADAEFDHTLHQRRA